MSLASSNSRIVIIVDHLLERNWIRELSGRMGIFRGEAIEFLTLGRSAQTPLLPYERIDSAVFGLPAPDLVGIAALENVDLATSANVRGALLVDLTDDDLPEEIRSACSGVLTPLVNREKGWRGLVSAAASPKPPYLSVAATTTGETRELLGICLAVPNRDSIPALLNTIFARLITLVDAAARHLLVGRALPLTEAAPPAAPAVAPRYTLRRKAKAMARSLAHRVAGNVVRTADWTIGYRRAAETPVEQLDLDPETFTFIPCDYGRFFADPMIFSHDGKTAIFFEDYDYATELGSLSCVALRADGTTGAPVEVMKRPFHLSYPFVFEHAGQAYMVPETGANRTVELWECVRFPDQWKLRSVLLEGVEAVDATLKFDPRQGLWWMFVSVAEPGGCTYDTLSIYYSDDLFGGWRPHALNPVKLDLASSRPAGPIMEEDGAWLRPAQDCTRGYGGGVSWRRITALTPEDYQEEAATHWAPPEGFRGIHTYCRAAGWEAIDLQRRRWRWRRP